MSEERRRRHRRSITARCDCENIAGSRPAKTISKRRSSMPKNGWNLHFGPSILRLAPAAANDCQISVSDGVD